MGVSMDGGMINIRDEGWKETKTGCVFEVKAGWKKMSKPGNILMLVELFRSLMWLTLANRNLSGKKSAEAKQRGWTKAA